MTDHLRTLRLAAWLGWQLETNWASPWLFALYMLVKPVCGSLMLVCMFYAARHATGGRVPAEFLPYLYVSNACYDLVGTVMFGLSYAVVRDREHYRMLKYVYISPGHFQTYFLGRGAARGLEGTVGGVLNITVGLFLFAELRRSLMGPLPEQFRGPLSGWSNGELALMLAATTAGLVVVAQLFWRWSERRAWRLGNLEENAGV